MGGFTYAVEKQVLGRPQKQVERDQGSLRVILELFKRCLRFFALLL